MSVYACGALLFAPDHTVLLLRRSAGGSLAGYWDTPGGRRERGERLDVAMMRELYEEAGYKGPVMVMRKNFLPLGPTSPSLFCLFECRVPKRFTPKLNAEHDTWGWFAIDALPSPLHPGLRFLQPR